MRAVLVAEGGQFDSDEGIEIQDSKGSGIGRFRDIRVGRRFAGTNQLAGEHHVHSVARTGACAIKEEFNSGGAAIYEAGTGERGLGPFKIWSSDQNVYILRVADRCEINGCHPCGDRVATQDGVRHTGGLKSPGGSKESLSDQFHGVNHPLKKIE
jgi:hypothetical protein